VKLTKSFLEQNVESLDAGALVFKEGDIGEKMYIILTGEIDIRKSTAERSFKTLIKLEKGDFFGEMALVEKKRRSATAVCTKPTKLLAIDEESLHKVLSNNPGFATKMIKILALRLRNSNTIIEEALSSNTNKMVWDGIVSYATEFGIDTFKGYRVNKGFFSEWACQHLGLTEATVKDSISSLLGKGFLHKSALGEDEVIVNKHAITKNMKFLS
jgi:CRP/FNR family cyclic AMP-dependent transcriptional regulator